MKSLLFTVVFAVRQFAVLAVTCTVALSLGCQGPMAARHASHVPKQDSRRTADDDSIPAAAAVGLAEGGQKSSGGHAHAHDGEHAHSHTTASAGTKKKSEDVAELADDDF